MMGRAKAASSQACECRGRSFVQSRGQCMHDCGHQLRGVQKVHWQACEHLGRISVRAGRQTQLVPAGSASHLVEIWTSWQHRRLAARLRRDSNMQRRGGYLNMCCLPPAQQEGIYDEFVKRSIELAKGRTARLQQEVGPLQLSAFEELHGPCVHCTALHWLHVIPAPCSRSHWPDAWLSRRQWFCSSPPGRRPI